MSILQPNFKANPAPCISLPCPANKPAKSCSSSFGASPLTGAFGVAIFLLFSSPALLGKVGIISFGFGLGSSLKYGCSRISSAFGRAAGLREKREEISRRPAVERYGNLLALSCGVVDFELERSG